MLRCLGVAAHGSRGGRGEQQRLPDSSPQGSYRLDRDGCCTYVNPAAARMFGWTAEALIGGVAT
jgi:PAS domain-containing protein